MYFIIIRITYNSLPAGIVQSVKRRSEVITNINNTTQHVLHLMECNFLCCTVSAHMIERAPTRHMQAGVLWRLRM